MDYERAELNKLAHGVPLEDIPLYLALPDHVLCEKLGIEVQVYTTHDSTYRIMPDLCGLRQTLSLRMV